MWIVNKLLGRASGLQWIRKWNFGCHGMQRISLPDTWYWVSTRNVDLSLSSVRERKCYRGSRVWCGPSNLSGQNCHIPEKMDIEANTGVRCGDKIKSVLENRWECVVGSRKSADKTGPSGRAAYDWLNAETSETSREGMWCDSGVIWKVRKVIKEFGEELEEITWDHKRSYFRF
jgi:hypothetical protein